MLSFQYGVSWPGRGSIGVSNKWPSPRDHTAWIPSTLCCLPTLGEWLLTLCSYSDDQIFEIYCGYYRTMCRNTETLLNIFLIDFFIINLILCSVRSKVFHILYKYSIDLWRRGRRKKENFFGHCSQIVLLTLTKILFLRMNLFIYPSWCAGCQLSTQKLGLSAKSKYHSRKTLWCSRVKISCLECVRAKLRYLDSKKTRNHS